MSERTERTWLAGDFWGFADPSLGHRGGANVHEQIAAGIKRARQVLSDRGIDPALTNPERLLAEVGRGSIEEVALGLVVWGRACQAMISAAAPSALSARLTIGDGGDRERAAAWEARTAGLVGECAAVAMGFGARLMILESMLGDLTASASTGRAHRLRHQKATAAAAAAAKAKTEPLRRAAAAHIREQGFSQALSLSAVARIVANECDRAEKDVRDAIRGLFRPRAPGSKEFAPDREAIERDYPA